jgi:hypothetical protein
MALRTDKAVEIFSAVALNKMKETEVEVAEAREAIKELAANPTPNNRYEIGQLVGFTVNDILKERVNYLNDIADTKTVAIGEKAMFTTKLDGIEAFIQAKGSTTQRSKVFQKESTLDTIAVSTRPYINFLDLASGKVNFDEIVSEAAYKMEIKMMQYIEDVFYAAFITAGTYSSPNYASGSGVIKTTIDPQIVAFQRFGAVSLLGDISVISKLSVLTGFVQTGTTYQHDPAIINEHNRNGFIGIYNACNVAKLVNPFEEGSLSTTILRNGLIYILPSGMKEMRPLKVVIEGSVSPMDQTNIDDRSFELRLDQHFGAGLVIGSRAYMGLYRDEALTTA